MSALSLKQAENTGSIEKSHESGEIRQIHLALLITTIDEWGDETMKYRGNQTEMWDAWFLNANGRIHAFHLQIPVKDCSLPAEECLAIGHIYSDDLIHWTRCPSILPPFGDDERDYKQKYTGCTDWIDGKYILFYTMRDKENSNQRIAAALSMDLIKYSLYENNPVIVPDDKILIGYENIRKHDWNIVDCRDLITVKCQESGLYYGYFAAAADVG